MRLLKKLQHRKKNADNAHYPNDYIKILSATVPTIFIGSGSPLWGYPYLRIPSQAIVWKTLDATLKPEVAILQEFSKNLVIVIPAEMCKELAAIDPVMFDKK